MTAQKAQIESLIQEIDEVLGKTAPRLPWVMSNDAVHQRQVLEQTRRYLMSLQGAEPQSVAVQFPGAEIAPPVLAENDSDLDRFDLSRRDSEPAPEISAEISATAQNVPAVRENREETIASSAIASPAPQPAPAPAQTEAVESAQQALQAVVQEMNYLRSNLLQPMRSDLDFLRQQRETLVQEIRQLEAQRQQHALPQQNQLLMEFLQAAFRQMQENLSAQVAQIISTLPAQASGAALPEGLPDLSSNDLMALSPAQRLEQMQRVQTQSDQLLLKLDSSLRIIFNSLQQNVQTYQDSLEQGLSRMHNLGQQGEAMFSALVTRLAEQLGREASTFLQSSIEPGGWEPALPPEKPSAEQQPGQTAPRSTSTEANQPEGEIARLLDELNELDAAQPAPVNHPFVADAQSLDTNDLQSLDLLDLELKQLDLNNISSEPFAIVDEDLTLFQEEPLDAFLSTDLTVLQDDSEPEVLQPAAEFSAGEAATERNLDRGADDSEVLDLLNQVGVEPQAIEAANDQNDPNEGQNDRSDSTMYGFERTELVSETPVAEPPLVSSPDSLYEDEFYQSLFGDANPQPLTAEDLFADVELSESGEAAASAADQTDPLSDLGQEDWFGNFSEVSSGSEELTIVEALDLPQTVENVLLPTADLQPSMAIENWSPAPIDSEVESEEVKLDSPTSDDVIQPAETAIETIGSLLDLVPFESSTEPSTESSTNAPADALAPNSANSDAGKLDLESNEQAFELAQPGEDLLADDPSHPNALLNFRLPADTLEQLAQDLSSLEGGDTSFSLEEATDWVLPDALDASEAESNTSVSNAFTLEGLESLFENLPSTESSESAQPADLMQHSDTLEALEWGVPETQPQPLEEVAVAEDAQKKKY